MADINELMAKLKAAAQKASGGDWIKESGDGWDAICSSDDQANGGFIVAHFEGPDAAANREFAQAASPENILALTEALEAAEELNKHLDLAVRKAEGVSERLRVRAEDFEATMIAATDRAQAAEARIAELESRARTVKLPDSCEHDVMAPVAAFMYEDGYEFDQEDYTAVAGRVRSELETVLRRALRAAGIKLQIEGE